MYLLELDKKNIAMSIAEALSILKPKKNNLLSNYLLIECISFANKKTLKKSKFGLIKTINKVIIIAKNINDLKLKLTKVNISKYYKNNFKVDCQGFGKDSDKITKAFGSQIMKQLKNKKPKVNVKNPETLFNIFKDGNKIIFTKNIWNNKDDIRSRENKELPETMPTTINPKLSKAIINLSGLKKGKLIDPFCGAGGILIEAARMGFKSTGFDIDKRAIGKAKLNLLYLGIKNVGLEMRDALTLNKKYDLIVTDLPYGKNSKINMNIEKLYSSFFERSLKYCKNMIVGISASTDKKIIPKQWEIIDFFELYVHKSMSKRFYILKKR